MAGIRRGLGGPLYMDAAHAGAAAVFQQQGAVKGTDFQIELLHHQVILLPFHGEARVEDVVLLNAAAYVQIGKGIAVLSGFLKIHAAVAAARDIQRIRQQAVGAGVFLIRGINSGSHIVEAQVFQLSAVGGPFLPSQIPTRSPGLPYQVIRFSSNCSVKSDRVHRPPSCTTGWVLSSQVEERIVAPEPAPMIVWSVSFSGTDTS